MIAGISNAAAARSRATALSSTAYSPGFARPGRVPARQVVHQFGAEGQRGQYQAVQTAWPTPLRHQFEFQLFAAAGDPGPIAIAPFGKVQDLTFLSMHTSLRNAPSFFTLTRRPLWPQSGALAAHRDDLTGQYEV